MRKLKPVIFVQGEYGKHSQNNFQQMLLLKALRVTQDPKELKQMIGVKTVAEVYRTLDKLAMRKEYHKVLAEQDMTFDKIVSGIKSIAEGDSVKDDVKLKAWLAILKSLGMDKYEESTTGGGSWEDLLLDKAEKEPEKLMAPDIEADYEVVQPVMPEILRKKKEEELADAKRLYE